MKKILKICGIRDDLSNYEGIDMIGFNFIEISKRKISPEKAKNIRTPKILRIGLFGKYLDGNWQEIDSEYLQEIIHISRETKMDGLQIYGKCDYVALKKLGFLLIQPICIDEIEGFSPNENIDFLIVETKNPGSGKHIDFSKIKNKTFSIPFLIAGGINESNIGELIQNIPQASGVDIASGVDNGNNICEEKLKKIIILNINQLHYVQ